MWSADEGVVATPLLNDISDQVFLSIVRGQNGDLLSRVSQHAHVHEHSHNILSLCQILGNIPNNLQVIPKPYSLDLVKIWYGHVLQAQVTWKYLNTPFYKREISVRVYL